MGIIYFVTFVVTAFDKYRGRSSFVFQDMQPLKRRLYAYNRIRFDKFRFVIVSFIVSFSMLIYELIDIPQTPIVVKDHDENKQVDIPSKFCHRLVFLVSLLS